MLTFVLDKGVRKPSGLQLEFMFSLNKLNLNQSFNLIIQFLSFLYYCLFLETLFTLLILLFILLVMLQ